MGLVLGLTGTFGSGKSTVSAMFAEMGCPVIDADMLAREALAPGSPGLEAVRRSFGEGVFDAVGELDRKALGAIVFADRASLGRLNAIVHPRVRAEEERLIIEHAGAAATILDVPLLFETGADKLCAKVAVVVVDEQTRFGRLKARGFGEREIVRRMAHQMAQTRKRALADWVIDNNGGLDATRQQVRAIHAALTQNDQT